MHNSAGSIGDKFYIILKGTVSFMIPQRTEEEQLELRRLYTRPERPTEPALPDDRTQLPTFGLDPKESGPKPAIERSTTALAASSFIDSSAEALKRRNTVHFLQE